jgi:hypothetical protein
VMPYEYIRSINFAACSLRGTVLHRQSQQQKEIASSTLAKFRMLFLYEI